MINVVFIVQHRGLSDEATEQEELCFPNPRSDEVINDCVIKKPTDFTADNSTIFLQWWGELIEHKKEIDSLYCANNFIRIYKFCDTKLKRA